MDNYNPYQNQPQTVPAADTFRKPPKKHSGALNIAGLVIGVIFAFITVTMMLVYSYPRNPNDPWERITDVVLIFIYPGALISVGLLSVCIPNLLLMDRKKPVSSKAALSLRILTPVVLITLFALLFLLSKSNQKNYHDEVFSYQGVAYTYYQKTSSDNVVITGLDDGAAVPERLELPTEINGQKVYKIGDRAFENQTNIKEVVLPTKLLILSDYAFSGCTMLEKVTLAETIVEINRYAFGGCTSLREIDQLKTYVTIDKTAFAGCTSAPEWTRAYRGE